MLTATLIIPVKLTCLHASNCLLLIANSFKIIMARKLEARIVVSKINRRHTDHMKKQLLPAKLKLYITFLNMTQTK